MARSHVKLASSLAQLERLQDEGRRVFRSDEFSRLHRERLIRKGFVREVIKGWLISSSPDADANDTTPWHASFWEFCTSYCTNRFGEAWHLSPEQSLLIHAEHTAIPQQITIHSTKGSNNRVELLFSTSIYDLKSKVMPPQADLVTRGGLRLYVPEAALVKVPCAFFARNPLEARVVLSGIRNATGLLQRLLDGCHSIAAGRLAGGLRRLGQNSEADEILTVMKRVGYDVRETDPFEQAQSFKSAHRAQAPIVARLLSMWEDVRDSVIAAFPEAPGLPRNHGAYLSFVDEIYLSDAYHSLSIEGYRVTPELIRRVQAGDWDPLGSVDDRHTRDALAAFGYWHAFRRVRDDVAEVIRGVNPTVVVRSTHQDWFREKFMPFVTAGLFEESLLAGYRSHAVFFAWISARAAPLGSGG